MEYRKRTIMNLIFYSGAIILTGIISSWYFVSMETAVKAGDMQRLASIKEEFQIVIYGILVFFLSSIGVEYLVYGRKDMRAIKTLTETINQISVGHMDVDVAPEIKKRDDEFGELARAFDRTLVSLKISMEKKEKEN